MMLLTQANRRKLPALRSTDGQGEEAIVQVKLFDPTGRLTYYVTEFDGEDTLYGWMVSPSGPDCDEWGYSSLAELQAVRVRFGLGIERDRYYLPRTVREAKA